VNKRNIDGTKSFYLCELAKFWINFSISNFSRKWKPFIGHYKIWLWSGTSV